MHEQSETSSIYPASPEQLPLYTVQSSGKVAAYPSTDRPERDDEPSVRGYGTIDRVDRPQTRVSVLRNQSDRAAPSRLHFSGSAEPRSCVRLSSKNRVVRRETDAGTAVEGKRVGLSVVGPRKLPLLRFPRASREARPWTSDESETRNDSADVRTTYRSSSPSALQPPSSRMERNESANEGGSSPDTVIARSSSEEDRNRYACSTSGEYVTVGDSSSSLDTVTSNAAVPSADTQQPPEDKKRGRFGALKSSFRKEGGLFKIRRKTKNEGSADIEPDADEKETVRKRSPEEAGDRKGGSSATLKKKKKKTHSLVRKLSLNKFRLSTEQEPRHTPEGGDSSRSQSQSSQESPSLSDSPSRIARKGQEIESPGRRDTSETRDANEKEKGETKKSEKLLDKPVSTVTVVQRKSPSLTIRSFSRSQHDSSSQEKSSRAEVRCSSTLPYALTKWPEQRVGKATPESTRKSKLAVKSESESGIALKSSPHEVRRKLSLLEEKRAIFQRRLFETTKDTDSGETVVAVSLDDEDRAPTKEEVKREENTRKRARHISVRKFDTFSTFEGTFDEETGVGYLGGIEEDYTESYDRQDDDYKVLPTTMGPMVGASDAMDKTKVTSQDSTSSQNNAPNAGVGEKREHLYKILVIGELGAGKTSIIKRYVHQFFSQHYRATIGVDFALKVLNWDPHTIIRLQLWDIAGQERFGNMTRVYYKEAVGAFIVFDVTRSATLDAVVKWKQDLDSKVQLPDGSPIPCVLLANKCDQQKEGLVNSPAKMDEYCKEKNFAGWFETSAKENINIEEAARFLVNKILQNDQLMKGNASQDQADGERFALNQSPTSSKKSCSC